MKERKTHRSFWWVLVCDAYEDTRMRAFLHFTNQLSERLTEEKFKRFVDFVLFHFKRNLSFLAWNSMRLMLATNTVECKQLGLINKKCRIRMKQGQRKRWKPYSFLVSFIWFVMAQGGAKHTHKSNTRPSSK